jgi:hypothetical protein
MKRWVRLVSARDWLLAHGPVRAGDYAARYGVDRYVAYQEMLQLGATIADGDRKYAVRPPSVPKPRRPPEDDPLDLGLIEWGGQLILPVGYTSGGTPYGLMGEELEALLKGFEFPGAP